MSSSILKASQRYLECVSSETKLSLIFLIIIINIIILNSYTFVYGI